MSRRAFLVLAVLPFLLTDLAQAAKAVPSFKRRSDNEKRFAAEVGEAIIKAAHSTAKKIALLEYKYNNPKPNRTELILKMEYAGQVTDKVTGKKYLANIVVKIDSTDKESWEVLSIDYSDNNNIVHSRKKLEALVKEMNK